MQKNIYVVEDDNHIQELIRYNLSYIGYNVSIFSNGEDMLKRCNESLPSLILLDVMLPGKDGFEICKNLRENSKTRPIPVIIVTARSDEFDKVLGLEIGADDYIIKPFSVRELQARVKAIFRRFENQTTNTNSILEIQNIKLDSDKHKVTKDGELIALPLKEFELLKLLIENKGTVMSRESLLDKIWGFEYFGETRTVDVHIRHLRQKIEYDDKNPRLIETVRGIGYKFSDNN